MLLVTGAKGQLGTELSKRLPEALFIDIEQLDISDGEAVARFVAEHRVDTVINCAAYTAVDRAEDEPELCSRVNTLGAVNLAKSVPCMIHISTDYVFDGHAHRPYRPDDPTSPLSEYGRSKLAGEEAVLQHAATAIVIRTAWLYSAHGQNFVKTMMRLGAERPTLRVVADQVGTPTHAGDLAAAIVSLLPQIQEGTKSLYHYSNEGVASWYDFAHAIMEMAALPCKVSPIATEDYPTRAQRPCYSVLDKKKIKADFALEIPHWRESLARCIAEGTSKFSLF